MSVSSGDAQVRAAEVTALRQEIVESQKARIDLLKYKLLAVAALGAIGIGVGNYHIDGMLHPELVLAIIPLVCIYVDVLCFHNTIRILVIAQFLKKSGDLYESFMDTLSDNTSVNGKKDNVGYFFRMEDWALEWSTVILCLSLLVWGVFSLLPWGYEHTSFPVNINKLPDNAHLFIGNVQDLLRDGAAGVSPLVGVTFLTFGLLGTILSFGIRRRNIDTKSNLFAAAGKCPMVQWQTTESPVGRV